MRGESEEIFLMRNLPVPENNVTSSSGSFIENNTNAYRSSSSLGMAQGPVDKSMQTDDQMSVEVENPSTEMEDPVFQSLQNQLSTIMVRATKEIMVKTKEFNDNLLVEQNLTLSKEKERHVEEKKALSDEIAGLESNVLILNATIHKKSEILMFMDKKLEQTRKNKFLSKYFLQWKATVKEKKKEELLFWLAKKHYEQNLKKKAFSSWMRLLRFNWKKRFELKITTEIYENQKSIVQSYESRILALQENASRCGKQLETLHRSFEDSVQMAYMQGLNCSQEQTSSSDLAKDVSNTKIPGEDRLDDCTNLYNLCSHCTSHLNNSNGGSSSAFSDVPHVNYRYIKDIIPKPTSKIHPSALPKRIPVMGTVTHSHQNKTTVTLCPRARETISVERHIFPVTEISSSCSLKKISNSYGKRDARVRSQKKLV